MEVKVSFEMHPGIKAEEIKKPTNLGELLGFLEFVFVSLDYRLSELN